jgi:hypothetical protein
VKTGAALRADALPRGTVIGGRFRVIALRGHGGMGVVYEAQDTVIGRRVAVKLVPDQRAEVAERFEREARAASHISSRHVAAVHDFGRDQAHGLYMVMELLSGETLDRLISREGAIAPREAVAIAAEIAEALHAAHSAGVVHRDLKPSNVMMLSDGGLKVLDFGIARLHADPRAPVSATASDTIVGTPQYISPECVAGEPVGAAADLYALGVVLFELLAGVPPFTDPVPAALLTKHLREMAPPLEEVRRDLALPEGLSALVARLLEKDPDDRPSSARSVADALRSMTDVDGPVHVGSGVHRTTTSSHRRQRRTRHGIFLAVGLAAVLAAITVGVAIAISGPDEVMIAREMQREPTPVEQELAIPAPPPEPPIRTIELVVTTEPPDATLLLDGRAVESPLVIDADGSEHTLEIRADGYTSEQRTFSADRDQSLEILLERERRRRPPLKLRSW